jgi:hypothetical protein
VAGCAFGHHRHGSFSALGDVPDDKTVVLGLVSTKFDRMEPADQLAGRISEASGFKGQISMPSAQRGRYGTYSRIRPRSRKPTAAYTRSAISVDCRLAVRQPRPRASCTWAAVSAVPSPRRRAFSTVPRL